MKKTKNGKIGTIFLVSVLALAGVGISYAGFADTIHVYGTVQTATVEFEIIEYSGTWVYKVYGNPATQPADEVYIDYEGLTMDELVAMFPGCTIELIAFAEGRAPTASDPEGYDAIIEFDNLFPCIDFIADIEFKIGTLPVKVDYLEYGVLSGIDWMQPLIESGDIWAKMCNQDGDPIVLGTQIHSGDIITIEVHIHLIQDNIYQDKAGSGYLDIGIIQWNDLCEEEPGLIIVEKQTDPDGAGESFEFGTSYGPNFFLTDDQTHNSGPLDPGIYSVAEIDIPSGWTLVSATCDDGSDPSAIYLDSGETVTCTFTNEQDQSVDISVDKTVDNAEPAVGSQITYTITATNNGPGDATGVVVEDILPDAVTYVSDTSGGDYDTSTGLWTVGGLLNGQSKSIDITVTVEGATSTVDTTQLCLLLDGSNSISSTDWEIMLQGFASSLDDGFVPHNGMVELTIIQFGGWTNEQSWAQVEIPPTILTDANYQSIADDIELISQLGGGTAMSCAFYLAADILAGDPNGYLIGTPWEGMESTNTDFLRQVVNLVTDGQPNILCDEGEYIGTWPGSVPNEFILGKANTEVARDYMVNLLNMQDAEDEIDSEAVGAGPDVNWLRDEIVYPQPGYTNWPPTGPGWVRHIDSYTELQETIQQKFVLLFEEIENCAELIASIPVDINEANDKACITITPQPAAP